MYLNKTRGVGGKNSIRKRPITQEKKMGSTDISKTENINWSTNTEKSIQYHVQLWKINDFKVTP